MKKTRFDLTNGTAGNKRGGTSPSLLSARPVSVAVLALILGGLSNATIAVPIDPSISINGSVEFGIQSPTNATQTGNLTRIVGGATTSTSLNGTTIVGSDPLSGSLLETGDGFGINFVASGTATGGTSEAPNLFGDLFLTLTNSSATDTFTVNFRLDYHSAVDSSGADAFGEAEISLDNTSNGTELFFTDLLSDTKNGDIKFVFPDGTTDVAAGFGDALGDSGVKTLSLDLAPGATVNFGDNSFEVHARGGTFDSAGGSFISQASLFLAVDSVVKKGQPPQDLPEPQS